MQRSERSWLGICLLAVVPQVACGGGGGGTQYQNRANVPSGVGNTTINMAGTWTIDRVQALTVTTLNPNPPLVGETIGILPSSSGFAVVDISGDPTNRAAIEQELGVPLKWYLNQGDGRIIQLAFVAELPDQVVQFGFSAGAGNAAVMWAEIVIIVDTRSTGVQEIERYQIALGK